MIKNSDLNNEEALTVLQNNKFLRQIWLAGGCFWGVEAYFSRIPGVVWTDVGYANGSTLSPSYEDIHISGHAETVHIIYDPRILSLRDILQYFLEIIDPTSLNKQGNDVGTQYRTGIYYQDKDDPDIIKEVMQEEQNKFAVPLAVEVLPLDNYCRAEEYHQKYLVKNPGGYCHINLAHLPARTKNQINATKYQKPAPDAIKKLLTPLQYQVTQEADTEPPFHNEFWNHHERGIYVDIVTGEPLFLSGDKFDSGCGWPSFTQPANKDALIEKSDKSLGMVRTEVRSAIGNSHLGHVFTDGPQDKGGLRYCINSTALKFIPYDEMEEAGYGQYISLIEY